MLHDGNSTVEPDCICHIPGTLTLPGSYEVKASESGVDHSQSKLALSRTLLSAKLKVISGGESPPVVIQTLPCHREEDTWSYRCRCSFQIIKDGDRYAYAMRQHGKPVMLGCSFFPIATHRIQSSMRIFIDSVLNGAGDAFSSLRNGLSSCTFSSAWHDVPESDCILSLNYDRPLDELQWRHEATRACQLMRLRCLNGRSKGMYLSEGESNGEGSSTEANTIRDKVFLLPESEHNGTITSWNVTLDPETAAASSHCTTVLYWKPETAFYHPNMSAMSKALYWLLHRLTTIVQSRQDGLMISSRKCLLEMYCGCGAHTVALAKTGLLKQVLAVELDPRLVLACKRNIQLNELESLASVQQGDAGQWAGKEFRRRRRQQNENIDTPQSSGHMYDILLVDPPRAGLDDQVCQMALKADTGNFQDFLYISCGHEALLRDLERLSPAYKVIECAQMDLFPRTNSIETLVHLQRLAR